MSKNYLKFYYNQNKYEDVPYNKPNGTIKNIKTSGCGVCCATMAVNNLTGKEVYSIKSMAQLSDKCGARTNNGTNVERLLTEICKKVKGLSFECTETTDKLIKHLKNGGVAILHQGGGENNYNVFSSDGHFVYAYGITNSQGIKVADPAYTANRYKTSPRKNRIISETSTGCIVSAEQVKKATTKISYYLISYNGEYYGDILQSPCKMFECNATMKCDDNVYADNNRDLQTGKVIKNRRIKALGIGKTNTIIQYGINAKTYGCGIVYTKNIKFD